MSVILKASGGGSVTLQEPSTASDLTVNFPAAGGTAMVSGNMPAFSVTKSSPQTINNNTVTKLTFNTETFDTNNNFASDRFTPTVAGYYQINLNISVSGLTTDRVYAMQPRIYKNGSLYVLYEQNFQVKADQWGISITALVSCNGSTDYIEAYFYQNNGSAGTLNIEGTAVTTQFSGSLVRGA